MGCIKESIKGWFSACMDGCQRDGLALFDEFINSYKLGLPDDCDCDCDCDLLDIFLCLPFLLFGSMCFSSLLNMRRRKPEHSENSVGI